MQASNLGYRIWAAAVHLFPVSPQGVSPMQLHWDLGITQRSAWHLAHRLRETWEQEHPALSNPVDYAGESTAPGTRASVDDRQRTALASPCRAPCLRPVAATDQICLSQVVPRLLFANVPNAQGAGPGGENSRIRGREIELVCAGYQPTKAEMGEEITLRNFQGKAARDLARVILRPATIRYIPRPRQSGDAPGRCFRTRR